MRHLARLLERPGKEVHVLDLARLEAGNSLGSTVAVATAGNDGNLARRDGGFHDGIGPALDAEAKAAYRERIEELRADIAEAATWNDPERAARSRAELDALTHELAAAIGRGGRDRQTGSAAERARVSVTRAIRSAMARIAAQDAALGAHLEATVRTGTFCSY